MLTFEWCEKINVLNKKKKIINRLSIYFNVGNKTFDSTKWK
jgi:hypothetical protein